MRDRTTFKLITPAADFAILASSFYNIAQQMGLTMQRTARSPIFSRPVILFALFLLQMES